MLHPPPSPASTPVHHSHASRFTSSAVSILRVCVPSQSQPFASTLAHPHRYLPPHSHASKFTPSAIGMLRIVSSCLSDSMKADAERCFSLADASCSACPRAAPLGSASPSSPAPARVRTKQEDQHTGHAVCSKCNRLRCATVCPRAALLGSTSPSSPAPMRARTQGNEAGGRCMYSA